MKQEEVSNNVEVWRRCQYPYVRYEVSNLGNIRHCRRKEILKKYTVPHFKYLLVKVLGKKHVDNVKIHIQVALAFVDGYAKGLEVNHKNANPRDNRASNLEWVSHQLNCQHHALMFCKPIRITLSNGSTMCFLSRKEASDLGYRKTVRKKNGPWEFITPLEFYNSTFIIGSFDMTDEMAYAYWRYHYEWLSFHHIK